MGEVAFFILVTRKYNFPHPWLTHIQDSGLQKLDKAQDGLPMEKAKHSLCLLK
jgi:hypothetical protein